MTAALPDLRVLGPPTPTKGLVVLWGLLGHSPYGGMTWQVLHHLAAFRRLGYDVWYVEDSVRRVIDPTTHCRTMDVTASLRHLDGWLDRVGLGDRWVFRLPGKRKGDRSSVVGHLDDAGLRDLYRRADVVFDLTGSQEPRDEHSDISCLVLLETDPVRSQVGAASGLAEWSELLARYHVRFTYASNLGAPDCRVPASSFSWHTTVPPVVADWWDSPPPTPVGGLSTIATLHHEQPGFDWPDARWAWSKRDEFRKIIDLPRRVDVAMGIAHFTGDYDEDLEAHGWRAIDSMTLTDPADYRAYIQQSAGEFSVAKGQYVHSRSGWFSDRTVCYLAAGRPAIVQSTGFERVIPTGDGLLSYETADEAQAAIELVASDYVGHCDAARDIAREHFDSERVLGHILDVCAATHG